ncbi:hypothetical protein SBA2_110018 [Acidobacteriia bacterium SbA2]|nr:hypothetical protein SBA2_110018 [Acidobacteriia bacterium SbA2]
MRLCRPSGAEEVLEVPLDPTAHAMGYPLSALRASTDRHSNSMGALS